MNRNTEVHTLPDTKQSVWELSAIQLSGWTSLPILATSVFLLHENSFYGAILTIIVGNAILWFIRLGIVIMSYKNRQSTLDISRDYLGNVGSYFIGLLLIISTLAWFIAQTTAASNTLTQLITIRENPGIDKFTQMSVLLGILSTFLCIEGIVWLKKLCTYAFPVLLIAFIVAVIASPSHIPVAKATTLSLSGLTLILATNLGITSDLPTFFRHSRNLQTSVITLTVIQLISIILAIIGLFFGSIISNSFQINQTVLGTGNEILRYSLIIFVFLSAICANVANVYSASVGWEVVAPKALVGRREYLILGLGLTTVFILASNLFSIEFLLNTSDCSLVNLCLVLILAFVIRRITKKEPSIFDQYIYLSCWFLSTFINVVQISGVVLGKISTLEIAVVVILLAFFSGLLLKKICYHAVQT